ncbi:hypothetical protein CDL15_Pgr001475 [Punica granatum]|uniref:CLAVATA3/ESR (CLE)-related protein 5-like n=1 Tax=Punica granatum TaxID=22663 RepID=A0A218WM89_PUNGR|nr:hypothetical protein CDL15_Pgr001475 [Punica granatum]
MTHTSNSIRGFRFLSVLLFALLLLFSTSQGRILLSPALMSTPMRAAARSSHQLMQDLGFNIGDLDDPRRALASEERVAPGGPDPQHHV